MDRHLRVAIDMRAVQQALRNSPAGGLGGPGRYAYEALLALRQRDGIDCVLLVDGGPLPWRLSQLAEPGGRLRLWRVGGGLRRFGYGRASPLVSYLESPVLSRQIARARPALVHIVDQPPPALRLRPRIVTAHDAGPLHQAMGAGERWPLRSLQRARVMAMAAADLIVCDSQATRNDIARLLQPDEERLAVIYPGVDTRRFRPGPPGAPPEEAGLPGGARYFLHVGVLRERKNPRRLLQAFREICRRLDGVDLVCAGPYQTAPGVATQLTTLAAELGVADRVRLVGDVSDECLVRLYRGSLGLVFPSLVEGFGFPVLEALACGVPCVTSGNSSLPEVGGELALYVDPGDHRSIAAGMERLLDDRGLRGHVAAAGPAWARRFSWSATAAALHEVYLRVSHRAGLAAGPGRHASRPDRACSPSAPAQGRRPR